MLQILLKLALNTNQSINQSYASILLYKKYFFLLYFFKEFNISKIQLQALEIFYKLLHSHLLVRPPAISKNPALKDHQYLL